jgi:23S rRNA (guanine2445-N2)-methyltransferase / 23S rRNA (guanine2069-N7)-methyltransferase
MNGTPTHDLFATAPRGLEPLLATELASLGLDGVGEQRGGVRFRADLSAAYRACLWSRIANRIVLRLTDFDAGDEGALYAGIREIDWSRHLGSEQTLAVDFTGIKARLSHSRFAAQRVKDAIVDQFRDRCGERPNVDTRQPDVRVNVHMHGDRVSVGIDLSGDSLHKRGYRDSSLLAPLKSNLAAAILIRAGWPELAKRGGGLVDPMCGSGTLLIEAAWIAGDTAPGLLRTHYGFLGWRGHDSEAWKDLINEAIDRQEAGMKTLPCLQGYDHDRSAVRQARANLERAGLAGLVQIECSELDAARPPEACETGLVVTNPPYGERLAEQHELVPLYLRLGETLRQHFGGWTATILNGSGCQIGLRPERNWRVFNGALECRLERFDITPQGHEAERSGAEDLVNRLHKNVRGLKRWLEREGIDCYRVYDADIPEYNLAVDVYRGEDKTWLHVQEYEAPGSVDSGKAQARLRAGLSALPSALDVPPERLVFKVRRRQRGSDQYEKLSKQSRTLIVREGRCRLQVNLTDYLDTGLFLDHRPVRNWIGRHGSGKRLLNLFCYTGAATVHAAVGGAQSTTSVDLSKTYLEWLRRNLRLNDLDSAAHRTVQADCREWLDRCRERFDLIFLDPPSFSNSKRMDGDFDVQRDHAPLIRAAANCLGSDGVLIFSTNLRRFRLDPDLAGAFAIEDRTAWSIPMDFQRNRRIHQCWFIRQRS